MKTARRSIGEPYQCSKAWPADCFVQCGDHGIVGTSKGVYQTAFFEAFPKQPSTFIRGEGKAVSEAEENAWLHYQRILACPDHEYKRHGANSEHGTCVHCNLFSSHVFPPVYACKHCGENEVALEHNSHHFCLKHYCDEMNYYTLSDIKPESLFDEAAFLLIKIQQAAQFKILIEEGLFDKEAIEYQEINHWEKELRDFGTHYGRNKILEIANSMGKSITLFRLMAIKKEMNADEEIHKHVFKEFLSLKEKISKYDIPESIINKIKQIINQTA